MNHSKVTPRFRFWLWLIDIIGVIVPRRLRADWRQEWEAELRGREALLDEWERLTWNRKLDLFRRSASAFWDALWLQRKRLEDDLFQDLRYGVRMLLKSKTFTTVAVLSLAVGIGANTAIFSLINALMLRMLPVPNAEQLVLFSVDGPHMPSGVSHNFNYPLYEMFRDRNQSFTGIVTGATVARARLVVNEPSGGGQPESVQQQRVSGNFFSVLGVNPIAGRILEQADDNAANTQPGAVISYEFWQRRFGLDPAVIGRQVTLGKTALTIVGVAPRGFYGFDIGARPELWWPLKVVADENLTNEQAWWLRVIGRLRPDASRAKAQAEMEAIFRQQVDQVAARTSDMTQTQRRNHFERNISLLEGGTGYTRLRQQFWQPLFILLGTVALVLLIACVNVANLLLARAATRRKEIAVRLAVGAGRFRLVRQLLTESMLLSVLGGAAGLLFARLSILGLTSYLPQQAQRSLDVALDMRVLAFTLIVSVVTGLLFGLVPALQATRLDLTASLKDHSGASASRTRMGLNKVLVVSQVALSLFLLIGAGLFVRSLVNLKTLDVGFNYDNIVQFGLDPGNGYNAQQRSDLYKQVLSRLEALPGAQSATLLYFSLLGGGGVAFRINVPGQTSPIDDSAQCYEMAVGPRFFETMKMPILAGRDFRAQDERPVPTSNPYAATSQRTLIEAPPLYAVINQAMARYYFGAENPIGKRFNTRGRWPVEIIGVTNDAKYQNLREAPPRTYYIYYFQHPQRIGMTLQLRTSGEMSDYASTIGRAIREIDPQVQVVGLRMMSEVVDESLVQERFVAQLGSVFSLFALLLACVGLYGVMSYAMTRRTNEIGIRMAIGASAGDVIRLVMREVMLLVLIGAGIGLVAALATTRTLGTLLFDLSPTDPVTITMATLLLLLVAALAGYLPARRASRIDPLVALRYE